MLQIPSLYFFAQASSWGQSSLVTFLDQQVQFFTLKHNFKHVWEIRWLFWLVAHIFGVVIVIGGSGLIADTSKLQTTISIISAGLLVTLTLVSTRNNIIDYWSWFRFDNCLRVTEVSSWISVLKIGPIVADPSNVIFAFLINDIFTRVEIHLLPTLTFIIPKQ